MIRYGRVSGAPKNTLYTVRRGDTIYFGISRCNTKHDSFRKDRGKFVAAERAGLVMEEIGAEDVSDLVIHYAGLRGACNKENVVKLLQYFDDVDNRIKEQINKETK